MMKVFLRGENELMDKWMDYYILKGFQWINFTV